MLIAAIAIINTVILSALERMGEWMMKAMGLLTRKWCIPCPESTGIGILAAWVCSERRNRALVYGMDWGAMMGGVDMTSFGIRWLADVWGLETPGLSLCFSSLSLSLLSSIYHLLGGE